MSTTDTDRLKKLATYARPPSGVSRIVFGFPPTATVPVTFRLAVSITSMPPGSAPTEWAT